MLDQSELAALIAYLKQDLDQVEQAILEFERAAAARKAGARPRARHKLRVHVARMWAKHRGFKDQADPS